MFEGFGIYYVDQNDKIKLINFDLITSDTVQDGFAAVRGIRMLREQDFFKQIEQKEYIFWADCGKHFRNNEFLGYLFRELSQQKIYG